MKSTIFAINKDALWQNKASLFQAFKPTSENKISLFGGYFSLILLLISSLALFFTWRLLTPEVPLFYSRPYGEAQLGNRVFLWLLPLANLVTFLFNIFFAKKFSPEEKLLSQVLVLSTSIVSLLSTTTLIKIIFLAI